jgi:hypothetical protein
MIDNEYFSICAVAMIMQSLVQNAFLSQTENQVSFVFAAPGLRMKYRPPR